jgi:hypothetical protein
MLRARLDLGKGETAVNSDVDIVVALAEARM